MNSNEELNAFARIFLKLTPEIGSEILPFSGRGSDRNYFRFRWGSGNSVILVHYERSRSENVCFADIAQYLNEAGIPVPRILLHDPIRCFIIMEDLGDTDLWALRDTPWETRKVLYEKTLTAVHRLHSITETDFPSRRITLMDSFGPDLYRWERNYFREHFVEGLCGIELDTDSDSHLEEELSQLAERLGSGERVLVHRDLQSKNVMIYHDEPFLIDFQGMRFGSSFYDLGSLLYDPYVDLTDDNRLELLTCYFELSRPNIEWKGFQRMFYEASVQRLIQALGAYGYLGRVRGLKHYLDYVPSALANLRSAAGNAASLPMLLETCDKYL